MVATADPIAADVTLVALQRRCGSGLVARRDCAATRARSADGVAGPPLASSRRTRS